MKSFFRNSLFELLAIAILTLMFAWAYMLSVTQKSNYSTKTTADSAPSTENSATQAVDLKLSKELGRAGLEGAAQNSLEPSTLPLESSGLHQTQQRQMPTWPAALFTLAFLCGWLARHLARTRHYNAHRRSYETDQQPLTTEEAFATSDRSELFIAQLDHRIESLQRDLISLADVDTAHKISGGSTAAEIEILRKKNVAKAEIIMALEDLVKENRENWLLRDETEERMNQRIKELTEDLNAAMSLMHDQTNNDDELDSNDADTPK